MTYLDQLYRAEDECRARLAAAEAAILAADTGSEADWPAYDHASKAFDQAEAELSGILDEIEEMEEGAAFASARQDRADYQGRAL